MDLFKALEAKEKATEGVDTSSAFIEGLSDKGFTSEEIKEILEDSSLEEEFKEVLKNKPKEG